ncbi:MAG: hypothetical protein JXR22_02475 [Prolixibacteraceae bacterium]|nr:hypothetical protein [Prolixibacteraceae bacterium]
MSLIENQRIGVWMNHCDPIGPCLLEAVYLSIKLEKEVCLFACYSGEKEKQHYEKKASLYAETILKDIPGIRVTNLIRKGSLKNMVKQLGDEENFVLLCFNQKINKQILQAFYRSGFPFYISKSNESSTSLFKKIMIPIDFRNNTKTATLWGSYLGRFNQSDILLYTANDRKDDDLQAKVESIIAFVRKFYGQFFFNFGFHQGESNSWKIHQEALKASEHHDLYIFTGSLNVTLLDWMIGPFEKRIVNQSEISVLMINPQKELYVLCD